MQLTGTATQLSTIAVAVLATGAVLLLWNRVRGPRAVRVLARTGLLAVSYAATAMAVLISVNIAYGGLIVSVNDLFSDPNAKPMHHSRQHDRDAPGTASYRAGADGSRPGPAMEPAVKPEQGQGPKQGQGPTAN